MLTPISGTDTITVAAALNGGVSKPCQALLLQSDPGNTANLVWGDATHQYNVLPPGASVAIPVSDVSKIWVAAAGAVSSRVNWVAGSAGLLQVAGAAASAVVAAGAAHGATSQVTAGAVAATLAIARATRVALTIKNTDSTNPIYVGPATVTSANGFPVLAGESMKVTGVQLWQVIAPAGAPVVAILDEYN